MAKVIEKLTLVQALWLLPPIISMLVLAIQYFIEGGWWPTSQWRTWNGMLVPYGLVVVTIAMIRGYTMDAIRQRPGWQWGIITTVFFIVFTVIGWNPDWLGLTFPSLYDAIYNVGNVSLSGLVAVTYMIAFAKVYVLRSPLVGYLLFITYLSFFAWTPLGEMIWRPLTTAGEWWYTSVSSAGDASFWFVTYIGLAVICFRVLAFKEKLRAG